jgi:hypothetical protein
MAMNRKLRKLALTAHITFSVGWLGAVIGYIVLAFAGLNAKDPQLAGSVYIAMDLTGWYAIVPLSIFSLLTGLIQSFGTEWGLIRHYWILAKFVLTALGTAILLSHMPRVSHIAKMARDTSFSLAGLETALIWMVVHAVGGLMVLLTATVLSVYKPWGRTPFGRQCSSKVT